MKKLSEVKINETVEILYLPYNYYSDKLIRYEKVKVLFKFFGNIVLKTACGIRIIKKEIASQITCE